jgi:hypothetical protein
MKRQLQIVWRGLERSPSLSEHIEHLASELEQAHGLDGCRVVIERQRHRKGHRFNVKLETGSEGQVIAVTREGSSEDAFAAVNEAFTVARREVTELEPRKRAVLRRARTAA